MAGKKTKTGEPSKVPVGSLERFTIKRVHRRQLKGAPYNPPRR